jgi:glycosyltransferase involved in cell wall biosynthesis
MGNNECCRDEDKVNDGNYIYDGFVYYAKDIRSSKDRRIDNYYSFPRVKRVIEKIALTGRKINIIIGYHMDFLGMLACIKYCQDRDIIFISDCTEWYDPDQTVHGRLGLTYYNSQLRMLIANKKVNGMIVISKYLEDYYRQHTRVIRIPPLDDVKRISYSDVSMGNTVRFVYCGTPGKKDDLHGICNAFEKLECNKSWEFHIVGISKEDFLFEKQKYSIDVVERFRFYGRVPIEVAQTIISKSDFSIFIRPEIKRYTKAGFPTKFSESFSLGIPVIANITSDLYDYLIDGENGIIVKGSEQQAIVEALNRALNLTHEKVLLMKEKANLCAIQSFDYQQYADIIKHFIERIRAQNEFI